MPELPEVETTRRGIEPQLVGRLVEALIVRERRLRWPIATELEDAVSNQRIKRVSRRAKYLLIEFPTIDALMIHLGMSGSLRLVPTSLAPQAHDHMDIAIEGGIALRYNDPRRFGSVHHIVGDPARHRLLAQLGPEPFSPTFNGDAMYARAQRRRAAVKSFIMDSRTVAGVGNIYATEALFVAGIHPARPAGRIARSRYRCLASAVTAVLAAAIEAGGTTLRDFSGADGRPGYFRQRLNVYGRAGQPCRCCGRTLHATRIAQRTTVFCPHCQR